MPVNNIVFGQKVPRELQERARELRKNMTPGEKTLGDIHDLQQDYDMEREQQLIARGFRNLRVSNEDVKQNLSAVMVKIREACS